MIEKWEVDPIVFDITSNQRRYITIRNSKRWDLLLTKSMVVISWHIRVDGDDNRMRLRLLQNMILPLIKGDISLQKGKNEENLPLTKGMIRIFIVRSTGYIWS